jgi:hypothetical protein
VLEGSETSPIGTLALTAFLSNTKHGGCGLGWGRCCSRANELRGRLFDWTVEAVCMAVRGYIG